MLSDVLFRIIDAVQLALYHMLQIRPEPQTRALLMAESPEPASLVSLMIEK
jgi:hypothetical protein